MTLSGRLTEIRERLICSGRYGNGWSEVVDATVCQEAIDRIAQLDAALRKYGAHIAGCEWERNEDENNADCDCGLREALQSETKGELGE